MIQSDIFRPAENEQAYLKALLSGREGSGKTWTAFQIALGLIEHLSPPAGEKMPLVMMDTEKGSSFLTAPAKAAGVPFLVTKTRVFKNLLLGVNEAERLGAVLVIDSITHFWAELQRALKDEKQRAALGAGDWTQLGDIWSQFSDRFVNSSAHIILTGRAGWDYDEGVDVDGNKTLAKIGTKLKAQAEMGFEPSLLIEMERAPRVEGKARGKKRLKDGKLWNYLAAITKDRTRTIEGKLFENPGFDEFRPAVEYLNLGGKQIAVDTSGSSKDLFRRPESDVRL